jgi:hypothetical protein
MSLSDTSRPKIVSERIGFTDGEGDAERFFAAAGSLDKNEPYRLIRVHSWLRSFSDGSPAIAASQNEPYRHSRLFACIRG